MKVKQIIRISLLAVAAVVLIWVVPLVRLATGGLRTPARVPTPGYWPTDGWRTSSPEEQGFDSAKLAEGVQALRENKLALTA